MFGKIFRGFASLASGNHWHSLAYLCFALFCAFLPTGHPLCLQSKYLLEGLLPVCRYVGGYWGKAWAHKTQFGFEHDSLSSACLAHGLKYEDPLPAPPHPAWPAVQFKTLRYLT